MKHYQQVVLCNLFPFLFYDNVMCKIQPHSVSCFVVTRGHHLHPLRPTHKSWHILKAVSLPTFQASWCVADHGLLPLPLPVVFALNPAKSFLRSLIASLRLSICLSTLLNCVLLNPCQMKTDGLIYPDVLWAFRRAVRAAVLMKGVLQSKGEAELSNSRPWDGSVFPGKLQIWGSCSPSLLLLFQGRMSPSLQGSVIQPVRLPGIYKEQSQGTAVFPCLSPRNSRGWAEHSGQDFSFCCFIQPLL